MLGLKPEYFDEIDSPVLKQKEAGPFRIGRLLGKGVSGSAYMGTHKANGFQVALKIVKKSRFLTNPERLKVLRREIAVMKLMDHPHVLKLYDVFESSDRIFLVTELAQGGELFDYIKDGVLPVRTALKLFAQITMGLLHCHNHGIAHRDLKPENLLLDGEGNIKIADFGMAQVIREGAFLKTSCGSPHYVSPELIDGKYDGKSSDVWSLGVILYAIMTGCLPFDHQNVPTLLRIVQKGIFEIPEEVDPDIQHLIRSMLKVDVKERIKMEDIFSHRVFQEGSFFSDKDKSYFTSETPRTTVVTSLDESVLADVIAILGGEGKEDIQAKILEPGENAEKSLYLLLMDRKNRRLVQLTRLSPLLSAKSRSLASSTRSSRSSSPTRPRILSDHLEPFQLPEVASSRAQEHVEIASKFLLERAQLVEPESASRRSSISEASSLPSSPASSVPSSNNPSRRSSFLNLSGSNSPQPSVPSSRRESLLTSPPTISVPTSSPSTPSTPSASTPSTPSMSRRASLVSEEREPQSVSPLELLRRHFKKRLGLSEKPTGHLLVTIPDSSPSPSTSSSRCTSPSTTRPSSPAPRSVFASFFRRRPSLDPWHTTATSPRNSGVETRSSRRPRSTSLPDAPNDQPPSLPQQPLPHSPQAASSTSSASALTSPSTSPSPSYTLFVPPFSPASSTSSSLFSPSTPSSSATAALPTLFEERS